MCSKSHINSLLLPKISVRVITLRQGWALCPVFLTKRDLQKTEKRPSLYTSYIIAVCLSDAIVLWI